jgi:hypothetical protein
MAQDAETTRAKVKKRSISKPSSGGNAQAHWKQDTPKQTPHRNAPLPNVPHARGPSGITGPKPHGNIAHSGGEALNQARHTPEHIQHQHLVKIARRVIQAHRNAPSHPSGDTKGDLDRAAGDYYRATSNTFRNNIEESRVAHLDYLKAMNDRENAKYSGSPGRLISGFINMKGPVAESIGAGAAAVGKATPFVAAAAAPAITGTLAGIDAATGAHTLNKAKEIVGNAGKELVDIPANVVPSAVYALGPLAAGALSGNSKKLGKGGAESGRRLTQGYVNLAKHPVKTAVNNPLSTVLMVGGLAKGADRLVGRAEQGAYPKVIRNAEAKLRVSSQPSRPYPHIEVKLPGTAAKQVVLPRQGALAYRLQKTRYKNVTRMSDKAINRRVDETHYVGINQARQDAYDAIANHQHNNPNATPKELEEVAKVQLKKSRDFYRDQSALDMAVRNSSNGLPRYFHGGKFDDARKAIEKFGQKLIDQGAKADIQTYTHGDKELKGIYHSDDVQTLAPYVLKTGPHKGKTILAPKIAIDQLALHDSYLDQTTTSAILQGVGGAFRRTVLPFSPKWLANNYTEAALRGAINGVGPTSAKAASTFYKGLSESGKKEYDQLVKSAGHGGMQRQLLQEGTKWEEKLAETAHWKFGRDLTKFGQMKGPKAAQYLFDKWTDISFHHLNGHMENAVHSAMAGRVLRRHPLMTQRTLELTHQAMKPEGKSRVEQRNNLIALGREVDRMFGKYGKFSPAMRRSIATWTPFIPWTLNAVHFITQHLPNDHPVVTSLIASSHQASQEWRNKHGLSNFIDGKLPPFLQGAVPGSNGSHWMIFSQGTPFSVAGDPTGTLANNFNPLGSTIAANLEGFDWKGAKLKNDGPYVRLETAILSALEGTTPIGYAANRVTGGSGGTNDNLKNWANPFHPVKGKEPKNKKGPFDQPKAKTKDNPFDVGKGKKKSSNPFDG